MADPAPNPKDTKVVDVQLPGGAGLSNGGPPIPDETPDPAAAEAANTNTAADPKAGDPKAQPKPNPKDTKVIPPEQPAAGPEAAADAPNPAAEAVKQALTIQHLDPHMAEMLRTARVRAAKDGQSLMIDLAHNEHCLQCGKTKEGVEFIGMPHKSMILDKHDAHIMVGLAKARGWKAVNVSGSDAEKDLLWIEAMRQDLKVANYNPDENNPIRQEWLTELSKRPKTNLTEAKDTGPETKKDPATAPDAKKDPDPAADAKKDPVAAPDAKKDPVAVPAAEVKTEDNFHVKTMQLLKDKAAAAEDKDVQGALNAILKTFTEGTTVTGTEKTFKALADLGDKPTRDSFNKAVDALNAAEPKLALTKLDPPSATPASAPVLKPDAPVLG